MGATLTTYIDPKCSVADWQLALKSNKGDALSTAKKCRMIQSVFYVLITNAVIMGAIVGLYFLFRYIKEKNKEDEKYQEKIDRIQKWTFIILGGIALLAWIAVFSAPISARFSLEKYWAQLNTMGPALYKRTMERAEVVTAERRVR